jgi:uncharacterized membrane protein
MRTPSWLWRSVTALEGTTAIDPMAAALDRAAGRIASGARGSALRGEWLGHALHPLLTDFPLGCWAAAGLLDVVGGAKARPAAQRLVLLGVLFVPATVASGMADFRSVDDRRVKRVGAVHAVGNFVTAGAYVLSWRNRRNGRHARGVMLSMLGGTFAWVTGYLGGHMSFARGTGVGERGVPIGSSVEPDNASTADVVELLDIDGAAKVLQVHQEQIEAMVRGDLLVPVEGSGGDKRFRRADVLAARLVGG